MRNYILTIIYFIVSVLFMVFRDTEAGLVLKSLIIKDTERCSSVFTFYHSSGFSSLSITSRYILPLW